MCTPSARRRVKALLEACRPDRGILTAPLHETVPAAPRRISRHGTVSSPTCSLQTTDVFDDGSGRVDIRTTARPKPSTSPAVTGPGASNVRAPTLSTGCTSRVLEVMKIVRCVEH